MGNPLKIHIQVSDADGFYAGLDLFPWRVDIPHEEVGFASGSSAIPAEEAHKLEASLAPIQGAVQRAGRFAEIKLYVAGHTDTVGGTDSNQQLSEARARAIAEWFRAHGVRVPIYYVGYGETALAVQTADETAEPRNRRAEYIVAITDPAIAHAAAAAKWKRL
jgi:outer membrane protein OmpA-like peptidoglycan-associated protein